MELITRWQRWQEEQKAIAAGGLWSVRIKKTKKTTEDDFLLVLGGLRAGNMAQSVDRQVRCQQPIHRDKIRVSKGVCALNTWCNETESGTCLSVNHRLSQPWVKGCGVQFLYKQSWGNYFPSSPVTVTCCSGSCTLGWKFEICLTHPGGNERKHPTVRLHVLSLTSDTLFNEASNINIMKNIFLLPSQVCSCIPLWRATLQSSARVNPDCTFCRGSKTWSSLTSHLRRPYLQQKKKPLGSRGVMLMDTCWWTLPQVCPLLPRYAQVRDGRGYDAHVRSRTRGQTR